MGRQIILSEEEKRNIQKMYGLINEQPIPPNSSNVARAASTIANGGRAASKIEKTASKVDSDIPSKLESVSGEKFKQATKAYSPIDINNKRYIAQGWNTGKNIYIGKLVNKPDATTQYEIVSFNPVKTQGDLDNPNYTGMQVELAYRNESQQGISRMFYLCDEGEWVSQNGNEVKSDFKPEFFSIGNKIKDSFCRRHRKQTV